MAGAFAPLSVCVCVCVRRLGWESLESDLPGGYEVAAAEVCPPHASLSLGGGRAEPQAVWEEGPGPAGAFCISG